jgi:hypothetical protein
MGNVNTAFLTCSRDQKQSISALRFKFAQKVRSSISLECSHSGAEIKFARKDESFLSNQDDDSLSLGICCFLLVRMQMVRIVESWSCLNYTNAGMQSEKTVGENLSSTKENLRT